MKKICQVCGKEFEVIPCRQNTAKYCSRSCEAKSRRKSKVLNCEICRKEFILSEKRIARRKHHFCSRECYKKWRYSPKVKAEINRKIGLAHTGKLQLKQMKRKVVFCEICGRRIERSLGYFTRKRRRVPYSFCSDKCWGIWFYKHCKKKNTDIEQIIANRLKKNNIQYESQKQIGKVAIVDFLIKGKIVIEADGDYWHSLSINREKDRNRDKILSQMGYIILRFLGSKIKERPDECIRTIKEHLTI